MSDFERIAAAIDYLDRHAEAQPRLADVAAHVGVSPHHFQRLFSRWAGISPKRYLQALTLGRAKRLMRDSDLSQLHVSDAVGLSSGSRLYDHFVELDAMTPSEFRQHGSGLTIEYGVAETPFGPAFFGFTDRGICRLAFVDDEPEHALVASLAREWPGAVLSPDRDRAAGLSHSVFGRASNAAAPLTVLVRGTNFQVNVWRALLRIPLARLASYGDIAVAVGKTSAQRAVGAAVGANPVGFLIPCHRVIRANGDLGGYRWGIARKRSIQAWEAARATP